MGERVESGTPTPTVVDLAGLAREEPARRPAWAVQSDDLNANLLVFEEGGVVAEHVNNEVDVLIVGIAGAGVITVNGGEQALRAGQAILVPRGATRATRSAGGRFAYLTCHRRRRGLMPTGLTERS